MTEPARIDVSVVPVLRNGVVVGATANGIVVSVPCRVEDHVPWLSWSPDGMGGSVARHRGTMVGVAPYHGGFRVTIDTIATHATRSDVYHAADLPSVAALIREVMR